MKLNCRLKLGSNSPNVSRQNARILSKQNLEVFYLVILLWIDFIFTYQYSLWMWETANNKYNWHELTLFVKNICLCNCLWQSLYRRKMWYWINKANIVYIHLEHPAKRRNDKGIIIIISYLSNNSLKCNADTDRHFYCRFKSTTIL